MSTVEPALDRPDGFRPRLWSETSAHQLRLSLAGSGLRLSCRCGEYSRFLHYGEESTRAGAIFREEHMKPVTLAAGIPWQTS